MRTVLRNKQEVCHVWASQRQESGRAGNVFFEGPSIYSYGHHFEMARFVTPTVVLSTTRGYSVSTSSHLGDMRYALGSHITHFQVPSFTDHAGNLAYFLEQANEYMLKATRARNRGEWLSNEASKYLERAVHYQQTFPQTLHAALKKSLARIKAGTYFDTKAIEGIKAKAKAASAAKAVENKVQAEAKRVRAIQQAKIESDALDEWRTGEPVYRHFSQTALRVKDNEVQTSHNASVPLIEARKLVRALKAGMVRPGMRVGLFEVRHLSATDITIGCHVIPLAEIERIAPQVMSAVVPVCVDCLSNDTHEANCASAGGL